MTGTDIIVILSLFIGTECMLLLVFFLLAPKGKKDITRMSVLRGIIERLFLIITLLNDFPHALGLFGALKLGTRLTDSKKAEAGSNDYYLLGNLFSVLAAVLFSIWYKYYFF